MLNRKIGFILGALFVLSLPVLANASTSRIAGMGVQSDYVKDFTNIFGYPSSLAGQGNQVYGEFGVATDYDNNYSEYYSTEDRAIGAVLGNLWDGKYGTFGFNMREYSPALGTNQQPYISAYYGSAWMDEYLLGTGFETFGWQGYLDPNVPGNSGYTPYFNGYGTQAFDLMWGKKAGKTAYGLRLNRSYNKSTYDQGTTHNSSEGYGDTDRNIFGFGGGVSFENSATLSTEIGVIYESRTFKFSNAGGTYESNGGGAYLVSGRAMWQWQPDVVVVPVARFYSFDMSTKNTPTAGTATSVDRKLSGWQVGAAGNWTVNQKDLFVLGVTFASNTDDNPTNVTTNPDKATESLMPTMFASLETHMNSWWTLRFGGRKGVFYSTKYETSGANPSTSKDSWSPMQWFMGTGVKLGTLQMDATLAQDFFHDPAAYLVSGVNSQKYYNPLFPKVTATYNF
jgi:hypothetical protein